MYLPCVVDVGFVVGSVLYDVEWTVKLVTVAWIVSWLLVLLTLDNDKKLLADCENCELAVGIMDVPLSQTTTLKLAF